VAVRTPEPDERPQVPIGPGPAAAALVALVVFAGLIANGRPIGAGDTRPTERVAASLVGEADFDLDEFPEVEDPFARAEGAHRVSIYPVASAVLAAPVFLLAQTAFALDETGTALAGKWAASLFTALAAAVLVLVVGRRHPDADAAITAGIFAFGTSMWSTSQALWQHPAAVLFLCVALLFMALAEREDAWAGRAGLPLALAVAARHADVVLVAVLALAVVVRWPRRAPMVAAWGAPVVAAVLLYQWTYFGSPLRHGFSGSGGRFAEAWGVGHLGLLVSPAKGLLVFTPVVIAAVAGMAVVFRRGERWWPMTLLGAAAFHWAFVGKWSEWHGGESWGPRMMTDALPLLFVFLPDGFDLMPRAAAALAAVSIGVQALGAFAYDYRWERLYRRGDERAALWDVARSPIPFYLQRRTVYLDWPAVRDGRAQVREHVMVIGGGSGSRVAFSADPPRVDGADAVLEDVHLQRGARVVDGRARLRGRWDGVGLRVAEGARKRRLELRFAGRGQGVLYVGEKTFWSEQPVWATYPVSGAFRLRHPYYYPESGGPDLVVTIGKSPGEVELDSIEVGRQN
jgi:hypothetical protein